MLNSITFFVINSIHQLVIFLSNLIGIKLLNPKIVIPNHLAVAFTEEKIISYKQLYDLIVHCSTYGIQRITFYDPWSKIKSDQNRFIKEFKKYCKNSSLSILPIFNDDVDDLGDVELHGSKIHISILGVYDGRSALVNACKTLSHLSREIKMEDIDEELKSQAIYEPDLLLKVGNVQSLGGYPPWSLRVTEIISLSSLSPFNSSITKSHFEEVILNFSRRDRRLGR